MILHYNNVNDFLKSSEIAFLNKTHCKSFLIILAHENKAYMVFRGKEEYYSILEGAKRVLQPYEIHNKSGVEYIFADKSIVLENEKLLYQIFVLYRFSSILEIREGVSRQRVLKSIRKFSFYDIFNFKRWKDIAIKQFFFDGEHLFGKVSE